MKGLRHLGEFLTEYAADQHNISEEFYRPCMAVSAEYVRITGYFSSLVFVISWPALREFVLENRGTIRIICSPHISPADRGAYLYGYSSKSEAELSAALLAEMELLLAKEDLREPARLLACLVSSGVLEVRFAVIEDSASAATKRIFHDKVGVFRDQARDAVGFRGSLNETFLGLSPTMGHVDSIDVFPSWVGGRDETRVRNAIERFEDLWQGESPRVGVTLHKLPPAVQERFERIGAEVDLTTALDTISAASTNGSQPAALWPHQRRALDQWEKNGRRGLLAHATGSGKTVTGAACIKKVHSEGSGVLVVVPSVEIQAQWDETLRRLSTTRPILCGGRGLDWRGTGAVRQAANVGRPFSVIAVLDTARLPEFLAQFRPALDRLLLVGDEVHRLGAPSAAQLLACQAAMRLGLSATPERAGDEAGTARIMEYFGGVVDRYQIGDALRDGRLTRYRYDIRRVSLTVVEQAQWADQTKKLGILRARLAEDPSDANLFQRLQRGLQDRAKIKKQASGKVQVARDVIRDGYSVGDRWLVYCDDLAQVARVRTALAALDVPVREFHSQMDGDRRETLKWFEERGGILVSVRCLDEGVDIPRATHGLILASSTNPREFVQRRGRILRRDGSKVLASLVDVLVMPALPDSEQAVLSMIGPEISRALLFARHSESPSTITSLENMCVELGIPLSRLEQLALEGFEEDE